MRNQLPCLASIIDSRTQAGSHLKQETKASFSLALARGEDKLLSFFHDSRIKLSLC